MSAVPAQRPARWLIILAFLTVYLIWGSSYIGIRFAVETIPPFLMAGTRFAAAGLILIAWSRVIGCPLPTRSNWRAAVLASLPMFLINNSLLVWAQAQGLPSGIAAVVIASTPMWVVLLTWMRPHGKRPSVRVAAGIGLGTLGIVLLANPAQAVGERFDPLLVLCIVIAAAAWAFGSLYGRTADLPKSAPLSTGMQLLTGGGMILILSVVSGDAASFDPASVQLSSVIAMTHLTLMSSVIAFTAFTWLMRTVAPARAMTYAYVNPVVAVFLGWLLAGETLDWVTLIAAGVIIAGVFLIVAEPGKAKAKQRTLNAPPNGREPAPPQPAPAVGK
ncbi:MAG: EamA family transporter [bacterium]|nr:EamA family transporter [bacterium]